MELVDDLLVEVVQVGLGDDCFEHGLRFAFLEGLGEAGLRLEGLGPRRLYHQHILSCHHWVSPRFALLLPVLLPSSVAVICFQLLQAQIVTGVILLLLFGLIIA